MSEKGLTRWRVERTDSHTRVFYVEAATEAEALDTYFDEEEDEEHSFHSGHPDVRIERMTDGAPTPAACDECGRSGGTMEAHHESCSLFPANVVENEAIRSVDEADLRREIEALGLDYAHAIEQVFQLERRYAANRRALQASGADVPALPRWAQHSPAFQAEHPWCGWTMAFAADSDWDTTGFGLERLVNLNLLLTTADGRSRPVNITHWQHEMNDGKECGIAVLELDTKDYEPMAGGAPELVRYEDIREIVVF